MITAIAFFPTHDIAHRSVLNVDCCVRDVAIGMLVSPRIVPEPDAVTEDGAMSHGAAYVIWHWFPALAAEMVDASVTEVALTAAPVLSAEVVPALSHVVLNVI